MLIRRDTQGPPNMFNEGLGGGRTAAREPIFCKL